MKSLNNRTDIIFDLLNYTFMILFAFICFYPFYYIFIYSISNPSLSAQGLTFYPKGITLFNYEMLLKKNDLLFPAIVSVARTVIGTLFSVLCCSTFAFILKQKTLLYRKFIYRFMVITMYLNAGLIPLYLTIKAYGLRNNFLVYILPTAISAFNVILVKTYMEESISIELEEAAKIDGAGIFTIFLRVVFPLCGPIVATIAVFTSVLQWNSWFDNLIYVMDPKLNTLQFKLYKYIQEVQRIALEATSKTAFSSGGAYKMTPQAVQQTVTMLVTLPIMLVYPFMQNFFVKGIMIGAIKA